VNEHKIQNRERKTKRDEETRSISAISSDRLDALDITTMDFCAVNTGVILPHFNRATVNKKETSQRKKGQERNRDKPIPIATEDALVMRQVANTGYKFAMSRVRTKRFRSSKVPNNNLAGKKEERKGAE
jgi:hypothetical protein